MEKYRIEPGRKARLADHDPDDCGGLRDAKAKSRAKSEVDKLSAELDALQEVLYAEGRHRLLVVLQGMDTSGKDGTIRHVFRYVDPLGVRVANFKAPDAEERARDYLWRAHREVPRNGEIVIFNRSHYEDVLAVRVQGLVPASVWKRRYRQINDFERMLAEEGTTLVKFYLHIDADEQKKRLEARRDEPAKRWKFREEDLTARKAWDAYMRAYEAAITRTATPWAPWYVVPSNHKWYRNHVVASVLIGTLRGLKMRYPEPRLPEGGIP